MSGIVSASLTRAPEMGVPRRMSEKVIVFQAL
jgi:hypothetical protein